MTEEIIRNLLNEMIIIIEKNEKKRKNVDYNSYELIASLCLNNPTIDTKEQCLDVSYESIYEKIKGCSQETFQNYKKDIEYRSLRSVQKYIQYFKQGIQNNPIFTQEIRAIYLEGKTITTPKIIQLNEYVNNKCAKADIYVEFSTNEIIGISIKQSKNCTKSNYSVEKIIKQCCPNSGEEEQLCKIRKQLLKDAGFENHQKEQRKQVNQLFYPKEENIYWNQVKQYISTYNESIKKQLVEYLYPIELPYILYEFDGKELKELKLNNSEITFHEHEEYYYTKKKVLRNAAKLFYQLKVNNQTYRVEIRWKGNIHDASPQFHIHVV